MTPTHLLGLLLMIIPSFDLHPKTKLTDLIPSILCLKKMKKEEKKSNLLSSFAISKGWVLPREKQTEDENKKMKIRNGLRN